MAPIEIDLRIRADRVYTIRDILAYAKASIKGPRGGVPMCLRVFDKNVTEQGTMWVDSAADLKKAVFCVLKHMTMNSLGPGNLTVIVKIVRSQEEKRYKVRWNDGVMMWSIASPFSDATPSFCKDFSKWVSYWWRAETASVKRSVDEFQLDPAAEMFQGLRLREFLRSTHRNGIDLPEDVRRVIYSAVCSAK